MLVCLCFVDALFYGHPVSTARALEFDFYNPGLYDF
jgi:hypothetical protein